MATARTTQSAARDVAPFARLMRATVIHRVTAATPSPGWTLALGATDAFDLPDVHEMAVVAPNVEHVQTVQAWVPLDSQQQFDYLLGQAGTPTLHSVTVDVLGFVVEL
jgi:hypothetical protein